MFRPSQEDLPTIGVLDVKHPDLVDSISTTRVVKGKPHQVSVVIVDRDLFQISEVLIEMQDFLGVRNTIIEDLLVRSFIVYRDIINSGTRGLRDSNIEMVHYEEH